MEKIEYINKLRETSNRIKPIIKNYLNELKTCNKELSKIFDYIAKERLSRNSLLLKPFLVRLAFEVVCKKDWDKIVPFCAAAELINISSYQSNFSFDSKHGITSKRDKNNQFIASFVTRELSFKIIKDTINVFDDRKILKILECFSESNKYIYLGQYYDLNLLTLPYYDMSNDFKTYLFHYIKRCDYLSGIFTQQCALAGGILADADEVYLKSLGSFGKNFGIGLSIVNDIGDLVLLPKSMINSLKRQYDYYKDLKQGKLTLPIMYMIKYGSSSDKTKLKSIIFNQHISEMDKRYLMEILVKSGAYNYSKKVANEYRKKAKKCLNILKPSRSRNLLAMMVSQLRTNKYFHRINKTRSFNNEG